MRSYTAVYVPCDHTVLNGVQRKHVNDTVHAERSLLVFALTGEHPSRDSPNERSAPSSNVIAHDDRDQDVEGSGYGQAEGEHPLCRHQHRRDALGVGMALLRTPRRIGGSFLV